MIRSLFQDHPATVGETYWQHLRHALGFARLMIAGGLAGLLHALIPGLCVHSSSRVIARLHDRMISDRVRSPEMWSDWVV